MASVVASRARPQARTAGAAAVAVGGGAAAALAVLTGLLGYVGSLPWISAPDANLHQTANQYLPLVIAWAAVATLALVAAALSRRSLLVAVALVVVALAVGFAATPLLTPVVDRPYAVLFGLLAWLVPAAALLLGLVALASRLRLRSSV